MPIRFNRCQRPALKEPFPMDRNEGSPVKILVVDDPARVGVEHTVIDFKRDGARKMIHHRQQIVRAAAQRMGVRPDERRHAAVRHGKAELLGLHAVGAHKAGAVELEQHAEIGQMVDDVVILLRV